MIMLSQEVMTSRWQNANHRVPLFICLLVLPGCWACASSTTVPTPKATADKEATNNTPSEQATPDHKQSELSAIAQTLLARDRGTTAFESVIRLNNGRHFETQTIKQHSIKKNFSTEAEYPKLVGDRSFAAQRFNREVYALVAKDLAPYLNDKLDLEKEKHPHWKDVKEYHNISYEIIYASDELISVLFYVDGYSWGAAHGYHSPLTLNYDLKRGRVLKLADLFKPSSKYLHKIAHYCIDDLSRQLDRYFKEDSKSEGASPLAQNYRAWVITPNGLVVIFEEYQVASYAEGEPKVLIPYEYLGDIINPHGALASLAVFNQ